MATPPKPFLQRRRHHLLFIPPPVVVDLLASSLAPLPPFSFKGHIVVEINKGLMEALLLLRTLRRLEDLP